MDTPRPLTRDEHDVFSAARLRALETAPYFAHILLAARPVALDGLGTFAVDAGWRLYLDPTVLTEWGPEHASGVLVHEAGHLMREHADRAHALGRVDHHVWNVACDAAINQHLVEAGIALPGDPITPQALGLAPGGIEETYYADLTRHHSTSPDAQGEGCGSGAGNTPQPWELPTDAAHAPAVSAGDAAVARRQTAHAIREHARSRGTLPAGLERWASAELDPPTVPWRRVLAGTVRSLARLTSGRTTYSYSRPSRRRLPGIVLPAMRAPKIHAAVVIDTSGSMSTGDLDAALSEVNGVVKGVGGAVEVLTCDASAGAAHRVRSARDVRLTGGGGTDMRVGIAAAERMSPRPDVIVVLTDGYTPWPDAPTRASLIVVVVSTDTRATAGVPAWATTLTASPTS